ncbi:MAG: uroporphyrinogen-III C-methyltransferase [Thermodesulfobacteriota bacterium]
MSVSPKRQGKAYLVGAGPGDPRLITIRGKELLEKAEVIIYDYLAGKRLLDHVPPGAEFIYAGKKGGDHTHTQEEINAMLVDRVRQGKIVVRLKGGDPFIFGRGGEELEELLKAGLDFEAVPGVTSASAAATFAGVPITHRDCTSSVAFITGHERPDQEKSRVAWDKIATGLGTLVFYMGIKNLPSITANLIKHGRDPETPVAVVRWASMPHQQSVVGTLATIADIVASEGIKPPALTIVGDVVNYRKHLNWYESRPLFGRRILVTRTREQASDLVARLEEKGATCLERPTIAIAPPDSWQPVDEALTSLADFDWLVFTSIHAIHKFMGRLLAQGLDARALAGLQIAAVGRVTADVLAEYGLVADLVPEEFTGEGLLKSLLAQGMAGQAVLLPRASKAREVVPEGLNEAGARVTKVPVYQNVVPAGDGAALVAELQEGGVDLLTFTSSSTVHNFVDLVKAGGGDVNELLAQVQIAAIGPITAKSVNEYGLEVDIQPQRYTIVDLVEAIVAAG